MTSCAVTGCDGGSSWHPIPKKGDELRAKWLEALGKVENDITDDNLHVCSRHFRPFDYAERGVIRKGVVPTMRLTGLQATSTVKPSPVKRKRKSRELGHLDISNITFDEDSEDCQLATHRPSRRAAQVAALKISDTVRKYNLAASSAGDGADSDEDFDLAAEVRAEGLTYPRIPQPTITTTSSMVIRPVTAVSQAKPRPMSVVRIVQYTGPLPQEPLPLIMECDTEPLSAAQEQARARATRAYSRSVSKISEAKAMGAKLIYCCPKESYSLAHPLLAPKVATKPATMNLVYDVRSGMLLSPAQTPLVVNTSSKPSPTTVPGSPAAPSSPATSQQVPAKQPQQVVPARSIPLITGGSTPVTANSLLMVKVLPSKVLSSKVLQEKSQQLEAQYRRVVDEHDPVPWLVERGVLRTDLLCKFCRDGRVALEPDPGALNGYSLRCCQTSCKRRSPLAQPTFFARFGLPLSKLVALLYHWARQSELPKVLSDVAVDGFLVRSVWRALQEVCARAVATRQPQLGGPGIKVEVGTAQMGRYLVLGALDRSDLSTRLKAVSVALGWNSPVFLKSLEPWLRPGSVVVTEDIKFMSLSQQGVEVRCGQQPGPDLVHCYLRRRLTDVFGHFMVNQLKLETVQGFLDELQWRERFGKDPREAFWRIMTDILEHSGWKVSFEDMLGEGGATLQPSSTLNTLPKAEPEVIQCDSSSSEDEKDTEGCVPDIDTVQEKREDERTNESSEEPDEKTNNPITVQSNQKCLLKGAVVLDEYYYARKKPCPEEGQFTETKGNFLFKCPICKKLIVNNVKTVKHITNHIEGSRQKNPDLSDLTICKYCFREFETPYSMQCHMEVAHLKEDGIVCRICSQEFDLVPSLIDHMKLYHNPSEMPYSCQLCGFRSSFHKDVLKHFHQDHLGTNALLCRFCLRVYVVKFSNNLASIGVQNFYCHLFKHLARTSARRCPVCCLVFLTQGDMKTHRDREHASMRNLPGVEVMKSADNNPVLVPDPHVKPRRTVQNSLSSSNNSLSWSPSCQPRFSVPAVHLDPDSLHCACLECRKPIDEDHYNRSVSCGECSYTTNCSKAFADHMMCRHFTMARSRTAVFKLNPTTLRRPGLCPCGFRSIDGNTLVLHMQDCEQTTAIVTACGPTTRRMKPKCLTGNSSNYFPPLISLDDEETNLNEPFSEVFSSSVSNELASAQVVLAPVPISVPTPVDRDSQSPSILNMLGLMRRPSLSSYEDASEQGSSSTSPLAELQHCPVGLKSTKQRWAAGGLPVEEVSDSEPPILERQNSSDSSCADHCLEEAPSLEPQVELVQESQCQMVGILKEGGSRNPEEAFSLDPQMELAQESEPQVDRLLVEDDRGGPEEAPSLEPHAQLVQESQFQVASLLKEEGRGGVRGEEEQEVSMGMKEKTWPTLEPCIVLDSTA